jgi:hypothetical protein
MRAGDGSWEPFVELHNPTDEVIEASGGPAVTAELHRPDGTPIPSRQREWPTAAVLMTYRLESGQSRPLRVSVRLLPDEKASLPPGRYRLSDVRWGQLRAPDVDVEISET